MLHHKQDNSISKNHVDAVMELLADKYDNDLRRYPEADKYITSQEVLLNKLKNINTTVKIGSNEHKKEEKYTHINLLADTIDIEYTDTPAPLLAYSLDTLSYRRIFPFSFTSLIDGLKSKDYAGKHGESFNEAEQVLQFVRDRILNTQFNLNGLSLNKSSGQFTYTTTMMDGAYGSVIQTITAKMDAYRTIEIPNTTLKGRLIDLAHNYSSLFAYFMSLGFTEFYARCNCAAYASKYGKKVGNANYFCPHILYSMVQLPYYMLYYLR